MYPGGHISKNETPEQALIREVKEETGLDVEILGSKDENLGDKKNDVFPLCNPYVILCEKINAKKEHYHIDLVYFCKIIGNNKNNLQYNPKEVQGIGFFNKNNLKNINLFPNFRKLLEKVLE